MRCNGARRAAALGRAFVSDTGEVKANDGDLVPLEWCFGETHPPAEPTMHAAFLRRATGDADVADATAVAMARSGASVSYAELLHASLGLAATLRKAGVAAGDAVAVLLPRSLNSVVAAVATTLAGATYIPLDEHYPAARTRFCASDCGARVVLGTADLVDALLPGFEGTVLTPDGHTGPDVVSTKWSGVGASETDRQAALSVAHEVNSADCAYVMYTSGSTGRPKGVLASHRAAGAILDGMSRALQLDTRSAVLGSSPASFDCAIVELWGPLSHGCAQVLTSYCELADAWYAEACGAVARHRVDVVTAVPAVLAGMLDCGLKESIEQGRALQAQTTGSSVIARPAIVSCGEALQPELAQRLRQAGADVFNGYGPTETHYTTCHPVLPSEVEAAAAGANGGRILIGGPLAHQSHWVLCPAGDDDGAVDRDGPIELRMARVGEIGELYVGGESLADGYMGLPERTSSSFLDPGAYRIFRGDGSDEPIDAGRLYATNDRIRWASGGVLDFLGREDHQMNILGLRVESGEVEAALAAVPGVTACAVMQVGDEIAAYVAMPSRVAGEASGSNSQTLPAIVDEVGVSLLDALPPYHVPTLWCIERELPTTPTGKVDRTALASRPASELLPHLVYDPEAAAEATTQ